MTRLAVVALLVGLLPGICLAQDRGVPNAGGADVSRAPSKFFYTVLADAGDEWLYRMPECGEIPASVRSGLTNCEPFNGKKHHQMCESSRFVESTNVLTRQKRKFMLIYHVFDKKTACVRDRKEALNGD